MKYFIPIGIFTNNVIKSSITPIMRERITFALVMGIVTTGIVSFTLVTVLRGFVPGFFAAWIKSWLIAYATAIPVIILVSPKVQLLVAKIYGKKTSEVTTTAD